MPFDYGAFYAQLSGKEASYIAVRGHLWIESEFNRCLAIELAAPEAIDVDRMTWRSKLDLCQALGRVSGEDAPMWRLLNRQRNKLAHQVDAEVTPQDLLDLHRCARPKYRAPLESQMPRVRDDDHDGRTYLTYASLLMVLSYDNDRREWEKTNEALITAFHLARRIAERTGQSITAEQIRANVGLGDPPDPRDSWLNWPGD